MSVDLAKLRALLEAATPRPWWVMVGHCLDPFVSGIYSDDAQIVETDAGVYPPKQSDADLIVSAVNALPELLAVFEAACAWRTAGAHPCGEQNCGCTECQLWSAIDRA